MGNNKRATLRQVLLLVALELAVSALTVGVYLIIGKFNYTVVTGAALGSAVTVFNFLFLTLSVDRAVDNYLRLRGEGEMSEEELEKFTAKHSATVQNAAKLSYVVRTFAMLGALVLAFISGAFDLLSTVIPLLMYRPLMFVIELILGKRE